jgi:hypothetical protein
MKRTKKPGYYTLLVLTILLAFGAILTIMPVSWSYKECILGYKAHCTLTPVSTILCIGFAVIIYVVMNKSFTKTS